MRFPGPHGPVLESARADAAAGAWAAVRASLEGRSDAVAAHAELAVLLAEAQMRGARPRESRATLQDVMRQVEAQRDRALLRRAVNLSGAAAFELGELDEAERAFGRALDLARTDADDLLAARATNNLALIANVRGRRDEALALYQLAIPAYQRVGDPGGLAASFHNMAITFRDAARFDTAEEYERRAIEYAREAGDTRLVAIARAGRAELCLHHGDPALAAAGARYAARDFAAIPDPIGEANALRLLGIAALELGRLDEARDALDRAVQLAADHGNAVIEAEGRRARAQWAAAMGTLTAARTDAAAAIEIFRRLGAVAERGELERWLETLSDAEPR